VSRDALLSATMAKVVTVAFAVVVLGAAAWKGPDGMGRKGFRHVPSNKMIPTATITDAMRKAAPAKLDWTTKGATTPVKDQGDCGSCWAYSTTEGVESGLFMATGKIVELSPQQIISCDKGGGDYGCDGGDVDSSTEWLDSIGGLDTEKDYPDTSADSGKDGKCWSKYKKVVKIADYKWAIPDCKSDSCDGQRESDLMAALNSFGPLSICLAADWGNYKQGVFNKACSHAYSDADHCVQLVGYDSTGSQPYWKVRNSWSSDWGEEGHIRLPMGINSCGLANWPMLYKSEMISEEVVV
jgi:C1A family cysteine protease